MEELHLENEDGSTSSIQDIQNPSVSMNTFASADPVVNVSDIPVATQSFNVPSDNEGRHSTRNSMPGPSVAFATSTPRETHDTSTRILHDNMISSDNIIWMVQGVEELLVLIRNLAQVWQTDLHRSHRSSRFVPQNSQNSAQGPVDYSADNENDGPNINRKRTVMENHVHVSASTLLGLWLNLCSCEGIMRDFLRHHGLRISKHERRRGLSLKDPPLESDIADYEAGNHAGPNIDNITINWKDSLTSQWNASAIHLLAENIYSQINSGQHRNATIQNWMSVTHFCKILKNKLVSSRDLYLENLPPMPASGISTGEKLARIAAKKTEKATRSRRTMRRHSVCIYLLLTYIANCRAAISDAYQYSDGTDWVEFSSLGPSFGSPAETQLWYHER